MSVVEDTFYNIQCDVCGEWGDDECWSNNPMVAKEQAECNCFYELGGKHYCSSCYKINEDEEIIYTADGKKFSLLDDKEIQ